MEPDKCGRRGQSAPLTVGLRVKRRGLGCAQGGPGLRPGSERAPFVRVQRTGFSALATSRRPRVPRGGIVVKRGAGRAVLSRSGAETRASAERRGPKAQIPAAARPSGYRHPETQGPSRESFGWANCGAFYSSAHGGSKRTATRLRGGRLRFEADTGIVTSRCRVLFARPAEEGGTSPAGEE